MVRLFDTKPQNAALRSELVAAFERVLDSGQFILGPEVERFEAACAEVLGARHAIGVSSGTDALLLALMALEVGPGDEVIVPDFSFFATAGCVSRVGATPVFGDVCPVCFNLRPDAIGRLCSARTRAVIPVHLFGQAARIEEIMAAAEERGIRVIEDAAQAFGARRNGRAVGTFGTFGAYSFFPTKNLGGFGDAGLLTTEDPDLAERARVLRLHGMQPKYYHPFVGGNFRLDALQAALLGVKLPHLERYARKRAEHAAFYTGELSRIEGVRLAAEGCTTRGIDPQPPAPLISLPATLPGNEPIWNQYTIRVHHGRRDELREALGETGIGAEIYYPLPLHAQECYADGNAAPDRFPVAGRIVDEVLSLPIYPELEKRDLEQVVAAIAEWCACGGKLCKVGVSSPN